MTRDIVHAKGTRDLGLHGAEKQCASMRPAFRIAVDGPGFSGIDAATERVAFAKACARPGRLPSPPLTTAHARLLIDLYLAPVYVRPISGEVLRIRAPQEQTMRRFPRVIALAIVLDGLALAAMPGAYGQAPQTATGTSMQGFVGDIEELSEKNSDFRRVLYTGKRLQLVVMTLKPGEEIGEEVHGDGDQFFRVEEGEGEVVIDGKRSRIKSGDAVLIPAGARHNLVNTGKQSLHVYTLYAPPEHRDRTVHPTKADAEKSSEHFDGKTTE